MKKALLSLLLLAFTLAFAPAWADPPIIIQQSPNRLDACQSVAVAGGTPTVNTQVTATINVPAGNFAYICSITADVCANNTGTTAISTGYFTSTNLPSNPSWMLSFTGAINTCAQPGIRELFGTSPIKSAVAGTNVTIVSPAAAPQDAYTIRVSYYVAP